MGGFRSRSESARSGEGQRKKATGYQQRRPEHRQRKSRSRGSGDKVRDVVFGVLRDVTVDGAFGNLALPKALRESGIKGRDAAFATELTYGTLRARGLLDAIIEDAAGRKIEKIDSVALDALRLGAYQILRTRVENHAAVNTSVELVKAFRAGQASGFVNGVLRALTRKKPETWIERVAPGDSLADLALRNAHPEWIAEVFAEALGVDPATDAGRAELECVLAADDARPIVHLAARPGQISGEELALITGGTEGKFSPYAVYLDEGAPGEVAPVREGMASVQDEGSQLIGLATTRVPVADNLPARWLDLCAGPGGKTAFIASVAMSEQATVDAIEIADHRAKLIEQTTRDLPVRVHVGDGRKLESIGLYAPEGGFARVLIDAPCSGLGALRRRPEARWTKDPQDVAPLVTLQRELLVSGLAATAPGGVVIYSTCSPHPKETSEVVRSVAARTGAEILDVTELLPELAETNTAQTAPFVQLWPHIHGTDAMFFAALRPANNGTNTSISTSTSQE